jgi:hypothetical protein
MGLKPALASAILAFTPFASAALYDQVIQINNGPVQGHAAFNSSPAGGSTHWKDSTVWKGISFAATTGGENVSGPLSLQAHGTRLWTRALGEMFTLPLAQTMTDST